MQQTRQPDTSPAWVDLDPFTQGAVEAAISEIPPQGDADDGLYWVARISDLAPEALARIVEDCAGFQKEFGGGDYTSEEGKECWDARQNGWTRYGARLKQAVRLSRAFPPLRLFLAEDGLIHIAEGDA